MRGADAWWGELFSYADLEMLPRAMLLQAFRAIRSAGQLMEPLKFDLPFRWLAGPGVADPVRDHSTFSKNRDPLHAAKKRNLQSHRRLSENAKDCGHCRSPKGP